LTLALQTLHIRSTALHSRLTQRERLTSLSLFRASVVPVLVSTDVAARGLDIAEVAMVVNWDLPDAAEEYTHRVGRTARAGCGGVAISFVTEKDEERILRIEERISTSNLSIPLMGLENFGFFYRYEVDGNDVGRGRSVGVIELGFHCETTSQNGAIVCLIYHYKYWFGNINQELHDKHFGRREEIYKVKAKLKGRG
jgi:hypothetical protein